MNERKSVTNWLPCKCHDSLLNFQGINWNLFFSDTENVEAVEDTLQEKNTELREYNGYLNQFFKTSFKPHW